MDGTQVKLADVCEEWLNMKRLGVKDSTYARYVRHVRKHIIPSLGEMTLGELSSSVINTFIYEKMENGRLDQQGPLSAKTVRDICVVLKSVLKYGEEEYQMHRIATNTVLPKRKKPVHDVLSTQELRRLRNWLQQNQTDARCTGLLLCMYTGLRIGEICALRWSDIDLKKKTISVNHTLQRIPRSRQENLWREKQTVYDQEGQRTGTDNLPRTCIITDDPKSVSSFRTIPIPEEIYPAIREMNRSGGRNGYFLTSSERCIEPRNYQYFFKRVLENADVRHVKFHTLRHTFATRCVEMGMDVKTLSEILGHSSTNITMNYYVHCSMESRRKMMNKFRI